jgi:hypothetical protein
MRFHSRLKTCTQQSHTTLSAAAAAAARSIHCSQHVTLLVLQHGFIFTHGSRCTSTAALAMQRANHSSQCCWLYSLPSGKMMTSALPSSRPAPSALTYIASHPTHVVSVAPVQAYTHTTV